MRAAASLLALAVLSGCGEKADNAPGPGGVTVGEARALDEAAEMIESRRVPTDAAARDSPAASASPR